MLKLRCSSLGKIMTEPKTKAEGILSVGAKTYICDLAKQFVYDYKENVSSKAMEKGVIVEPLSIDLYNAVNFTSHTKNTERKENAWLTGECDIAAGKIIDIKSSWSLSTFPATRAAGKDSLYEWQVRGYMMLWDRPAAEVAYCMVSTPEELIGYEDEALHIVDHIDPGLRVTALPFDRCLDKEALIKAKCEAAQIYFELCIEQINEEHA